MTVQGQQTRPRPSAPMVRRPPVSRRPGNSRTTRAASVLAAIALSGFIGWGDPSWWALPLAAAGFSLCAWLSASPTVSRTRWASAPVDAAVGTCLALDAGAWVVLCALLGVTVAQALRDVPLRRATDTVVRTATAAAIGAATSVAFEHLGYTPSLAAACGMFTWWIAGHALSVLAVSRTTGRSPRTLFVGRAGATLPGAALGAALGITSAWLVLHAPAGLLGLTAPVVLVMTTHLHGMRNLAETQILRELLGAQTGRRADADHPGRRSMDDSVQLLMTSAARLLGGADVEVLALGPDGALRFAGRERGDAARSRVLPGAYDDPWVRRCLQPTAPGNAVRARRGVDARRPVLAVRLGPAGSAGAVLLARRPTGAAAFTRADAAIAEALASRTAAWLPTALVGAEPTDEYDVPNAAALTVVRSSAARMGRLADPRSLTGEARRVDLDAVVGELRELERSVAALLGGHDEPPVVPAARESAAQSVIPDAEAWTTSGTMERQR